MVGGVLGFGVHTHGAARLGAFALGQVQHLFQRGDLVLAVVRLVAVGQGLDGAQGLDFGQGEVRGEPAFFFRAVDHFLGLAAGKFGAGGHIGGAGDVGLVACNQRTVLGGDQVRLDEIGAHLDGPLVAFERVVRQVARGTPVANHQGLVAIQSGIGVVIAATASSQRGHQGQRTQLSTGNVHALLLVVFRTAELWAPPVTKR
ncbi:hypothetical protein D3C71_1407560 [compost metagenome]